MQFTNMITIDRPITEVFAFLARFENVPRWNAAISETQRISIGPMKVGVRYAQTRTRPTRSEEQFEVTAYEPDRKLAIRGTFGPFSGCFIYELELAGNLTRLVNTVDLEPSGPVSIIASLMTSRIKAAVAGNLNELKQILESV
jgi:uncharacterized protein YndB with AHSA1/START domain